MGSNPLREYFENSDHRLIHKWFHYFDIYHRHFSRFRDQKPTIVEFGVFHGGSLQMWKHYFGDGAKIFGVDINPKCKDLEEDGIQISIGDQTDRNFLHELCARVGPIDILIDDGGHKMKQQIITFEEMYPAVAENGVYLAEDLHTSYWKAYGGGIRKKGSFVEYSKLLLDQLNAWHVDSKKIQVDDFTRSAYSMTYYDSILVIEKAKIEKPHDQKIGPASY